MIRHHFHFILLAAMDYTFTRLSLERFSFSLFLDDSADPRSGQPCFIRVREVPSS